MALELSALLAKPTWTEDQFQRRQLEVIAEGVAMQGASKAERIALLPQAAQDEILGELTAVDWTRLLWDWNFWGRPKQLVGMEPDPDVDDILWLAGRMFGKNRTATETIGDRIQAGRAHSICFVGADWRDVRRNMVGGLPDSESGILDVLPPWIPAKSKEGWEYNENKGEIYIYPHDCTIYLNSGEVKEQRGGNFDLVWLDEPIKYRYLLEVMSNLDFALRKGEHPQRFITTTPKNQQWLRNLIMMDGVKVVHGTSSENTSLARRVYQRLIGRYGGSRLGEQELDAKILGDNDSAIATSTGIDRDRMAEAPTLLEVGVGIDPAVSTKRRSDDSGIVVAARFGGPKGSEDARLALLGDKSDRLKPDAWALRAVDLAIAWGATFMVVERNKIGDAGWALLGHALRARSMMGKIEIREAYSIKDKGTRAMTTLSPLYDRGHAHHVGRFGALEYQLTQWEPTSGFSPNELDAYTHVATELMGLADVVADGPTVAERWEGFEDAQAEFETEDRDRI
jgi:phage terminase large subunit-like protein